MLARVLAIGRRDALIQVSYQFQLVSFFTGAFSAAFLAYYVSGLVDGADSLSEFSGSYFDFVVAGLAVTAYAGFGVSTFTGQVTAEQAAGTLEVLLSGPSRLWVLLVGGMMVPFLLTTIEAGLLVAVGIGFFGTGFTWSGILASLPILLATVANFGALGFMSAGLTLLAKRGDPISGPLFQLTLLMSGAVFPIELFPDWLETLCRLTPGYYGVRGFREALLTSGGFSATLDELAVLVGFAVVLVPLGLWAFGRSVSRAKALGVLASY